MARNMAVVPSNWFDSNVGATGLAQGHSDDNPSEAIDASPEDGNGWAGTGNSSAEAWSNGWEQRRTHQLSNGMVVWDVSGNVWEWVKDNGPTCQSGSWPGCALASNDVGVETGVTGGWTDDWQDLQELSPLNQLLFGEPAGYSNSKGVGRIYGESAGGIKRGAKYSYTSAGIFMAYLYYDPTFEDWGHGFRCVHVPAP